MNKLNLAVSVLALAVSGAAIADQSWSPAPVASPSIVFEASIGSAAGSGGVANAEADSGYYGNDSSVTSLSTGSSFGSTSIGFNGFTKGDTNTSGHDHTTESYNNTESTGDTFGKGNVNGLTSTSVAGHTDNAGVTGEQDGYGEFKGNVVSESGAYAGNDFSLKINVPEIESIGYPYDN